MCSVCKRISTSHGRVVVNVLGLRVYASRRYRVPPK